MRFALACSLLASLTVITACQSSTPTVTSPATPANVLPPTYDFTGQGESLVAMFEVTLDPASLEATVAPLAGRAAANQPPQAISYDLDIARFLKPGSFKVTGVSFDGDNDLRVSFTHRHPFPAPNFSNAISGSNRADLGYTGRLLVLADATSESYFSNAVRLDPTMVKSADGYCDAGDLLQTTGLTNNTFPYVLLADDGEDNRVGVSNGGTPTGSYDVSSGGWQRANIGDGTGWTGHDYVHGGQTVANEILLKRAALQSSAFQFRVAVLIKYTDPRGRGGRSRRFPADPADVLEFAYRCPFADLDNSKVTRDPTPVELISNVGATGPVAFELRDWDAAAIEAGDADLSDEGDVSLIQAGASGIATASIDAPFLSGSPQVIVPGGTASGLPGSEVPFAGTLTNTLGTASAGDYIALLQLIDPEDGDPAAVNYHKGVDPNMLTIDPARALAVRTYQAIPVHITQAIIPPTITAVLPTGTVGVAGAQVTFSATTSGDPVDTWSWNFNGGALPNTSAVASPIETLGSAGTYASATVTASNAGGSSAPFTFSYTVTAAGTPPTWQIHIVTACKDQYQALAVLNGKLAIGYATNTGAADFRFAQATVATPTSSAQWSFHDVDTANETGYTPTAIVQPSGMIALAFRDWTNKDLRIARALTTTPVGPGDWQVHAADTAGDVGHYTSVCIANGILAVAHTGFDFPNRPRFSRATSATPTSTADWQSYDLEGGSGGYTPSLTEFNGRLALLFSTGGALRYGRAQIVNPSSAANWSLYDVESAPGGGDDWPSLTVHGGKLAAAYCARGAGDLKLARALITEPLSSSDWSLYIIDATSDTGYFPSMVEIGGRLAISYMDFPNKDFRMARATVANPATGGDWQTQLVDGGPAWTGGTTRLVVLGSVLAASYYDIASGSVKVAISSNGW